MSAFAFGYNRNDAERTSKIEAFQTICGGKGCVLLEDEAAHATLH